MKDHVQIIQIQIRLMLLYHSRNIKIRARGVGGLIFQILDDQHKFID